MCFAMRFACWVSVLIAVSNLSLLSPSANAADSDCIEKGGKAVCTNPQPTNWKTQGVCLDDYRGNAAQIICDAVGGAFAAGLCSNIPQIPDDQWPAIAMAAGIQQNQAWGSAPCPSFFDTNWPPGRVYGFWCYASGIPYAEKNGIPVHGGRSLTGQNCPSGAIGTRVITERHRDLKCPRGFDTRTLPNGDLECYRVPPPTCDSSRPTSPFEMCGNPINAADSEKVQVETDYSSPQGLRFYRTYNSYGYYQPTNGGSRDGKPLGDYWTHNYEKRIFAFPGNTSVLAVALRANGEVSYFNLSGSEVLNRNVSATLQSLAGGGWKLISPTGEFEIYDSEGLLTQINQADRLTLLTYSDTLTDSTIAPRPGLLIEVKHFSGSSLKLRYDTSGHLVKMIDPDNKEYVYAYNGSTAYVAPGTFPTGNLTSVLFPDGAQRTYHYNEPANTSNADSPHSLTGISDESGTRFATWKYTALGRAYQSEHAGGADLTQIQSINATSWNIVDGSKSQTYSVQTVSGVKRIGSITQACPAGNCSVQFSYDANGNVESKTDFNGNVTTYSYDLARNIETNRTEAFGTPRARSIATQWHPTYRLPMLITEAGRTSAFTYDASGDILTRTTTDTTTTPNVSHTWTYTYNDIGQVLTVNGPRTDVNDTTTYTYYNCSTGSQCGQLQTITNALSQVTTYDTYNAHGQPLTITNSNGVVTTLTYDLRQRLTSRTIGAEQTIFEYWPTGLLKKATLPDGSYLDYTYDAAHRLTASPTPKAIASLTRSMRWAIAPQRMSLIRLMR